MDASIVTEEEIVRVFSLTESQHTAHQRALDELVPLFDQSFPVIEGLGYVIEQLVSLILSFSSVSCSDSCYLLPPPPNNTYGSKVKNTSKSYVEHAGNLSYFQGTVQQWKQELPAFQAFLSKVQ